MTNIFAEIMEKIIDKLEDDDYKSYLFYKNKFHIIDESDEIDFEAVFSKNCYKIKDNTRQIEFISKKDFLNEEVTQREIFLNDGYERFYYSFLEKDGYTKLMCLIRKDKENYIICQDRNTVNKNYRELIKYANEKLDKTDEEEDYLDVDELHSTTERFEEGTISEYEEYIKDKVAQSEKQSYGEQNEDVNLLLEYYDSLKILINGREIKDREKIIMAEECDILIEDKHLSSIEVNGYAYDLCQVLIAKNGPVEETQQNER